LQPIPYIWKILLSFLSVYNARYAGWPAQLLRWHGVSVVQGILPALSAGPGVQGIHLRGTPGLSARLQAVQLPQ